MSLFAGATGVLGGTFDPVHLGHIAVAAQCRERLDLAEVRLVPSFLPPHRQPPVAPAADRLAMTRLAAERDRGLVVDDIEVRRGGTSYSVDTLRELREPGRRLVLLLGYDAAIELSSWHQAVEILALAEVVVFNRTGAGRDADRRGLPAGAAVIEVDSPDISATEVREWLAAGLDMSGMLAAPVLAYIHARGLYGAGK
ncbi:MAG TPA: nicotinate (nicotinamide) nucleotide adenylyltransferase [Candidatus Dormibacteraeota bacterium]|nr:nicotinate (nicotinamide) nucleotide adenylyltransferase [Candidatus Dormibacteraeota bacterium]